MAGQDEEDILGFQSQQLIQLTSTEESDGNLTIQDGFHSPVDPIQDGLHPPLDPMQDGLSPSVDPIQDGLHTPLDPIQDGLNPPEDPIQDGLHSPMDPIQDGLSSPVDPIQDDLPPPVDLLLHGRPWWESALTWKMYPRKDNWVPGKQSIPRYPRQSSISKEHHFSLLKVFSSACGYLPTRFPTADKKDLELLDSIQDIYLFEAVLYRSWAEKSWVNENYKRTLTPKPILETVYDAQFRLKKNEISALPNDYILMGEMSLNRADESFNYNLQHVADLISVDVNKLPLIEYPREIDEDLSIITNYVAPDPCPRHTTGLILPDENELTTLTLPDANRDLAEFAVHNGATFMSSEKALQCLLDTETAWKLPVSIMQIECPEGRGLVTVVIIGSEIYDKKDCAAQRSYKAYRHLLRATFTQPRKRYPPTNVWATWTPTDWSHAMNETYITNRSDEDDPENFFRQQQLYTSSPDNSQTLHDSGILSGSSVHSSTHTANNITSEPEVSIPADGSGHSSAGFSNDQHCSMSESRLRNEQLMENSDSNFPTHQPDTWISPDAPSRKFTFAPLGYILDDHEYTFDQSLPGQTDETDRNDEILRMHDIEQERRSTESAPVTKNSNAAMDVGISSVSFEPSHLISDDDISSSCQDDETETDSIHSRGGCRYRNGNPPPRSFKKWKVTKTPSDGFHLIIHSSHKTRKNDKEAILEPIIEWQPELGASKLSPGRVRALTLALMMRPDAELVIVRVDYKNGNIIMIESMTQEEWMSWQEDMKEEICSRIYMVLEQLSLLTPGQYILAHDATHDEAKVYAASAEPARACFAGQTLCLNPARLNLSHAEEEAQAKSLYSDLGFTLLPNHLYHKILPLAFSPDIQHVAGHLIRKEPLVRVKVPPPAITSYRRKKNRR